jgi:hypothetical protein
MDPRLRAAVDASVRWYDDVFALHRIPVRVEDGLWVALRSPPPWHSAVKTLQPGIETGRAARAVAGFEHCSVADSFADLDLEPHGFTVLFDSTWLHHDPVPDSRGRMLDGWSVIDTVGGLAEWASAHDYAEVLTPAVLDHPRFRVLAHRHDGALVGGAVTHDGGGAVGLSNAWGTGAGAVDEVLAAVTALHPGRPVTDYAHGAERDAMVAAGFRPLGPQRVWIR